MKCSFVFLILISLVLAPHLKAQSPFPSVSYEQNPPEIKWKHILTEHFDLIFPLEVEQEAQRVAHLLEKAYPYVTRSLEVRPVRIPLVLQNQSIASNAFVTLAPRRSEWYMTPAVDPELTNTEWLKTLAIHEFRHVVQFQKTRQGFNKYFEIFLGEIGQALGLGLTLPPWFLEGDAVGIETALTKGGRGRLPLFERDLRALLLSGEDYDYDKAHLGSYRDYVPDHYVYGYFLTSSLRNSYGDLFLSRLADESAERTYNPLTFYNSTERLTGEKFETFYRDTLSGLVTEWAKKQQELRPTPYEVLNYEKRHGWTNYLYPQVTDEGEIFALKRGLSFIDQFVLFKGKEIETVFYPGPLAQQYPVKLRKNKVAFLELDLDPRWGNRNFSKLQVLDLNQRKVILTKDKMKARLAALNHSGTMILLTEWDEEQGQFVTILDLDGREVKRFPFPREEVITSLDWINDQEIVLVIKDRDDLKSLEKLTLENLKRETLLQRQLTNFGFVTVEEERILFESPQSGIDNIYLFRDGKSVQLLSSEHGAYAPELHQGQLIYNNYTVKGMDVARKTLPWSDEQASQDSFVAVYEKFSQGENADKLASDLVAPENFKAQTYSQLKHAINLHSWILIAPPLSSTISIAGFSRDVLNKFSLSAGGSYNFNERTLQGFTSATWSHLYPVFDVSAAYGGRRQRKIEEGSDRWEEGTFETGVSVPWKKINGRLLQSFTTRAFARLIKVTSKKNTSSSEITDGALFSSGLLVNLSGVSRSARRDILPPLGASLSGLLEHGKDITGEVQRGTLKSIDGRLFLPGLGLHHSFWHQLAYENQHRNIYEYASQIFYPRGTQSLFLHELQKYSGNYTLPIAYPDWNWSRYVYLKRVYLNLFYDELQGRFRTFDYQSASAGWEAIFETHFLRLFLPLNLGLRGSYILKGPGEESNYEVFFTSLVGTF